MPTSPSSSRSARTRRVPAPPGARDHRSRSGLHRRRNAFVQVAETSTPSTTADRGGRAQGVPDRRGADQRPAGLHPRLPPPPPPPPPRPTPPPPPPRRPRLRCPTCAASRPARRAPCSPRAGLRLGTQRNVIDNTCNDIGHVLPRPRAPARSWRPERGGHLHREAAVAPLPLNLNRKDTMTERDLPRARALCALAAALTIVVAGLLAGAPRASAQLGLRSPLQHL